MQIIVRISHPQDGGSGVAASLETKLDPIERMDVMLMGDTLMNIFDTILSLGLHGASYRDLPPDLQEKMQTKVHKLFKWLLMQTETCGVKLSGDTLKEIDMMLLGTPTADEPEPLHINLN